METTYVMIKPDGVQRGLIAEILGRFERKGLKLVGLKSVVPSQETAEAHYEVHKERPFYPGLIKFVTSGPVVCMAWSGKDAITVARTLIGSTNGREASPGTIRGDFGMDMGFNMIHGSDAAETAAFELGLWFPEGLMEWDQTITAWVYE
ncbi:MAG: nucleoside-diphosphate kinase [Candidatus Poseidoniaceae archaeon]|jgi:nucleoside-diphosphate kinase|nr:nucleoside-diphosphate kinase [Candidatus Poseidoniaceae archaeon]RJU98162.1 MAG: nucleoside-diphosphate kinase [Candidatus Poseidoniales archaeon]|tara:strand:+ start:630 stop:1076 length:447 start_codon:yes stop_codon:yes gene_type:complete